MSCIDSHLFSLQRGRNVLKVTQVLNYHGDGRIMSHSVQHLFKVPLRILVIGDKVMRSVNSEVGMIHGLDELPNCIFPISYFS